jgi:hypothetical protein
MTHMMKTPARITGLGGLLVVLAMSCTPERPEPGSDLPSLSSDASSEAGYPPMDPGSTVSGRYVADTVLKTLDGVVDAKLNLIFLITQTGVIADGTATLTGSVHIDQLEDKTKKEFTAVPVTKEGVFAIEVQNMFIPKEVNPLLNKDVTESVISFKDAHVINSCEFRGQMEAKLLNVDSQAGLLPEVLVFGPFVATGTSPPCGDGGVPEASDDATDATSEPIPDAGPEAGDDASDGSVDSSVDSSSDGAADGADGVADAQEGS